MLWGQDKLNLVFPQAILEFGVKIIFKKISNIKAAIFKFKGDHKVYSCRAHTKDKEKKYFKYSGSLCWHCITVEVSMPKATLPAREFLTVHPCTRNVAAKHN